MGYKSTCHLHSAINLHWSVKFNCQSSNNTMDICIQLACTSHCASMQFAGQHRMRNSLWISACYEKNKPFHKYALHIWQKENQSNMKVKTYQKYSYLKKMARFISIGIHNRTPGEPINLCVPVRFMTGNQKQNKTTSLIRWVFFSCHETNASNRTSIQFLVHLKDFSMSHLINCLCVP